MQRILAVLFLLVVSGSAFAESLPANLKWLTNDTDPTFADPNAKPGGVLRVAELSFPPTLRTVGPDSNSAFRSHILSNQMGLVNRHPQTGKIVRELASSWAFGPDKKSMFFKLDPNAKWSDGRPVVADDFVFTLEFMRSKNIVAPWYNDYYTKEIDKVVVYDNNIIGVFATRVQPDLDLALGLSPRPKHFYNGEVPKDFVSKYNWLVEPNTGPYQIDKVDKGKSVSFKRKQDWWAKDLRYYKNRFNVDQVIFRVVRDENAMWEHFKRGDYDSSGLTLPSYWHDKAKGSPFDEGYVEKIWFYTDSPQPSHGLYLNMDYPLFADENVRLAFQHAINWDKVIATVLRGDYERLNHAYEGYGAYSNMAIKARKYDLGKVDEYLKKSGWTQRGADGIRVKDGKRLTAELSYGNPLHTERMVVLREEAKKAGIELNLRQLDPTLAFKTVLEKKHQITSMAWSTTTRPVFWEGYHSDNAHKPQTNNICNLDDKDIDKLIDAHRNATEEKTIIKLALEIQQRLHDKACFIPGVKVPYFREAYWRWLRFPKPAAVKRASELLEPMGADPNGGGLMVGGMVWIDEERKKETLAARKAKKTFPPVVIKDTTYKAK